MSDTTRQLALVTGASSGIGRELANQFASNGFDVIIPAEDPLIDTVAPELEALGAGVEAVQADLATNHGVEELWSRVQQAGRPLAAAALNAGVGGGGGVWGTAPPAPRAG